MRLKSREVFMRPSSKRGQTAAYVMTWIIFTTLMLIIIFGSLIFWTDRALNPKRDTFSLQAGLLSQRLLYSPNGLAYVDPMTGRSYPGIIDAAKLKDPKTAERLLSVVSYKESVIGAKILVGESTVYYNKAYYDKYFPLIGKQGAGGARSQKLTIPLLVRDKDIDKHVNVLVEVVQVNPQ